MRRMHKTTIYLPDDIRRGLDSAARETGRSQAELIRTALHDYLGGRPSPWPASIGRHRSGGQEFGARDDETILADRWRG
jgi:metal-responsive CopG/Arc/MetJ family transcriptional regulator